MSSYRYEQFYLIATLRWGGRVHGTRVVSVITAIQAICAWIAATFFYLEHVNMCAHVIDLVQ